LIARAGHKPENSCNKRFYDYLVERLNGSIGPFKTITTNYFMKKLILGTLALIGACSMADANTLTVTNNTGCTYNLSIGGIGSSGPTVAPPGPSSFVSTPPSSGISGVKIMFTDVTGSTIQLNVGNGSPFASSMGMPAPACTTNFGYVSAIWQINASGDVFLTLM
jgi:hypothetical protein